MQFKRFSQIGNIHYAAVFVAIVAEDWEEIPYGLFGVLAQSTPAYRAWRRAQSEPTFRAES